MAWWSGSLGGLQDIAGAVNKISESVKNIEKNFDSALGLEEKRDDDEGSGSRTSNSDGMGFFNPVMAFMGQNGEESSTEVSEKQQLPQHSPAVEENHKVTTKPATSEADASEVPPVITQAPKEPSESEENVSSSTEPPVSMADVSDQSVRPQSPTHSSAAEENHDGSTDSPTSKRDTSEVSETQQSPTRPSIAEETLVGSIETSNSIEKESQGHQDTGNSDLNDEALPSQPDASIRDIRGYRTSSPNKLDQSSDIGTEESIHAGKEDTDDGKSSPLQPADSMVASSDDVNEAEVKIVQELDIQKEIISPQENSDIVDKASHGEVKVHDGETNTAENGEENDQTEAHAVSVVENEDTAMTQLANVRSKSIIVENDPDLQNELVPASAHVPVGPLEVGSRANDLRKEEKIQDSVTTMNSLESVGSVVELEKLKRDMKMMDAALQGAARQSQSKADEIARLMNENEQLKATIDELKGKSVEAEMDALKDEYHQRVATLERKVYALTKERDTLRREQNKKSDAAALLKEKDEIITQVMAEGEELSKKQAAQEATIRKLRAQIREFEEEKQRLNSKIQVEETKVESIKRDKAATEKLLQETIERNQTELAAQKEFYTNALNAAKEAEALAESRVNTEAKVEVESRLREACEKENMLINTIEELRNALTRQEQEAAFMEERLKRDHDDLQKRYQASELRYNELVTQVPESTRPLLRQIEAMQRHRWRSSQGRRWDRGGGARIQRRLTSRRIGPFVRWGGRGLRDGAAP